MRTAELHWYEASGISRKEVRIKRFVDWLCRIIEKKTQKFAVCVQNAGLSASLELRNLYAEVDDPDAEFRRLALPGEVGRALRPAS